MLQGWGRWCQQTYPFDYKYLTKQSPLDKKYYATRVGRDGASRHAHLITVSFKTMPIRQEISCFKVLGCQQTCPLDYSIIQNTAQQTRGIMFQGLGWGDGARRHAHLITVSLKLSPLDKRYHALRVGWMVLADMPT